MATKSPQKTQPLAAPAAPDAPDITPHTGGSYIRLPDGSLQRVSSATEPAAPATPIQPPAADPTTEEPQS